MSLDVHKAELQPGVGRLGQRQATHGGRADPLDAVVRATQRSSSTSRFMATMVGRFRLVSSDDTLGT